jgi:DNA-binding helix-hairpin-helix protein with protein kinase domain
MTGRVPLELGECLGRGGEARVFALRSDETTIAKLYHRPTPEHAQKLAVMIDHPPAELAIHGQTVIAWPTRRVFARADKSQIAGCLMPRVPAGVPAAYLHNMKSRLLTNPHFNWKYLVRAAMNMSLAFQKVHEGGYVIGDVNDQGVLIATNALAALVDCDSFQVRDPATGRVFRCPVGIGMFTPPELVGCNFANFDRTQNHDLFGLAVLVYQLLMGCHPFQIKAADGEDAIPIEDCIKRGLYPDVAPAARLSPVSPPLDVLPPTTRALFKDAFGSGEHGRPPAVAWTHELWTIDQSLRGCLRNANHFFAAHRTSCPWCERAAWLHGRDPFPSPEAIRSGVHLRQVSGRRPWVGRADRFRGRVAMPATTQLRSR